MWFMPSYGRPERLRELLEAPGGWPFRVVVLVNEDDPERERYFQVNGSLKMSNGLSGSPWSIELVPAGSRCADAHREISKRWPDEPWYGLLCDDQWPITPGWHRRLVEAAGTTGISTPNGEPNFPLLRNALVIGGDLARAMGSLVPAPVRHNYEDNLWDQVAKDFGVLVPLVDVFVEHRHWRRGEALEDATYKRGSADFLEDARIYREWEQSSEKQEMNDRIAKLLGMTYSSFDPKDIRLAIGVPIQDHNVDIAYHTSICKTLQRLSDSGIETRLFEAAGGSHVGKSRERVLWNCMESNPTHILFIDADMGWDPDVILRLIAADHEFSAIVGVRKIDELRLCANFLPNPQRFHEQTKFLEVRDVGFAFVLLKVSVVEKLCAAYPELAYRPFERKEFALFLDIIDDGERLSEDFSFCRRWRGIGGEIWIDPHASLIHAGRKEYVGAVEELFEFGGRKEAAE